MAKNMVARRPPLYLLHDLIWVAAGLLAALYLSHGLPLFPHARAQAATWGPELAILLGISALVFAAFGTYRSIWRYTSPRELAVLVAALSLALLLGYAALFMMNRLDTIPRSVPPLHWGITAAGTCGTRLLVRRALAPWPARQATATPTTPLPTREHVLILGVGRSAELYLQFLRHIAKHQGRSSVVVEGFLSEDPSLIGRTFHGYPVLGTPQALLPLIEQYHVHGIAISQIVLTAPEEALDPASRANLQGLARGHGLTLVPFDRYMGHALQVRAAPPAPSEPKAPVAEERAAQAPAPLYTPPRGLYAWIKRGLDILGALTLMLVLLPVIAATAGIVMADVGRPLLFWQERPGRFGAPLRLYKFRTMQPARRQRQQRRAAHKAQDAERTSKAGTWLRRLRLDELPQLVPILRGDMSFIGPRPLLPEDQPAGARARLSVRPGVTGWAQIHGGDALTPEQKQALDLWYIAHMSFWLDLRIAFCTLFLIVRGNTPRMDKVHQAQAQLELLQTREQPS